MTALALVLTSGALAWSFGGHEDSRASVPPPRGDSAENALSPFAPIDFDDAGVATAATAGAVRGASAASDRAETTAFRLVDILPNAQIDMPNLGRGEMALASANWRHMATPWLTLSGTARRIAMTVALSSAEKQAKDVPTATGDVWHPDAKKWNMNEGDFPQKEAFFAPTPSTITMEHALPAHARLVFSTALAAPLASGAAPVHFSIRVAPRDLDRSAPGTAEDIVFDETREAGSPGEWREQALDLGRLAGQAVEIRLQTTAGAASQASLALWGNPRVVAPPAEPTNALPYNVLWIVIDALRPDVPAALHDDENDAKLRAAHFPVGDALLPRIEGLTPNLDALVARGVHFTKAYSAAAWTRPGTFAMLAGARASELHLSTLSWLVSDAEAAKYYGEAPSLLPNLMTLAGADTRAFVNNYFMVGYAPVGLDMGFPEVDDHRYRLLDTQAIADDAVHFIDTHAGERFFAFCNFNSPHEPYEPPDRFKPRIPPPPKGPVDWHVQMYMGEAAKDDEAVGQLLAALERAKIADRTIVVVTSDHGETLSSAHSGTSELEHQAVRFHHAASNYEETTHVPLIIALPGHPELLPPGTAVRARVRSTDTAPTILDLEGLGATLRQPSSTMSGTSLLALAQGTPEADERVVVSEGRGTRAIIAGKWRLLTREGLSQTTHFADHDVKTAEELYDLDDDPGERHDVARMHPEVVLEMRARLQAALSNTPVAGTAAARAPANAGDRAQALAGGANGHWHFRFVGAGASHRISGTIHAHAASPDVQLSITPIGLPGDAAMAKGADLELSFATSDDEAVGCDVTVTPPDATVTWDLFEDDVPLPLGRMYGGEFGLPLATPQTASSSADSLVSSVLPVIDAKRDRGVFVTREPSKAAIVVTQAAKSTATDSPTRPTDPRATREMSRMLQQWGYARGPSK